MMAPRSGHLSRLIFWKSWLPLLELAKAEASNDMTPAILRPVVEMMYTANEDYVMITIYLLLLVCSQLGIETQVALDPKRLDKGSTSIYKLTFFIGLRLVFTDAKSEG